ncbi:MAG: cache domain-containing protein [Desulfobacteraceae bacterium]|nr:cache domain-containing protein [Desulfobacteraceae bacterium]
MQRSAILILAVIAAVFLAVPALAQQSATKEECVVKCHEAAAYVQNHDLEKAIAVIGDPNGPFTWKDSYVFLMNLDGKMLAHPFKPELTKKAHCLLITDPTGKALFVHFVNLARDTGEGWVGYMWPRPGENTPRKKLTYIYRIPGTDMFVGAGAYVGGMMY